MSAIEDAVAHVGGGGRALLEVAALLGARSCKSLNAETALKYMHLGDLVAGAGFEPAAFRL